MAQKKRRRIFSREYKLEAVRLIRDQRVSAAQASRDLGVHENVLRKWVRDFEADPRQAFPGQGQMKPEQLEIERLRREVTKLKAERDQDKVRVALQDIRETCRTDANLMPPIIAAAKAYCTEQEICDVFRDVFGRHQDRPEF